MEVSTLSQSVGAAEATSAYLPFRTAAVLGAGVMGSQIAAHLANAGLQVDLLDVTPAAIGREGRDQQHGGGGIQGCAEAQPSAVLLRHGPEAGSPGQLRRAL